MRVVIQQRTAAGSWYWYLEAPDGDGTVIDSSTDFGSPEEAASHFDELMNHLRGDVTVEVEHVKGISREEIASYQAEGAHG